MLVSFHFRSSPGCYVTPPRPRPCLGVCLCLLVRPAPLPSPCVSLLPGDDGSLSDVKCFLGAARPYSPMEWDAEYRGWFYHKAVWLVLPGGKKVVLTARVHKPLFGQAEGELVLLEMPRVS